MMKKIILIVILFAMTLASYAQDAKKYTTYIVKEGETLRQIARKVGCKKKDIKNLNPDVSKKPDANTVLVVPNENYKKKKSDKKDKKQDKQKPKEEIYYEVKEGDTFYGIARKYNIPIQAIKKANPDLEKGLLPGQRIRIPNQNETIVSYKEYKLHYYKVMKGDTKWSIANRHNISVSELNRVNGNHYQDLKEGENILVPEIEKTIEETETKETKEDAEKTFLYHRVKQGEGLFRIAVTYDTTQEAIIALNPEATKKLRPGMLLKIPGKKKDKFLIHRVIKGDTFYSLTRSYNVSEEQLFVLNNDLAEGLKLGMDLKIRVLSGNENVANTTFTTEDINALNDSISIGTSVHLSILLPLMVGEKSALLGKKQQQLQNISTDFYMGAEIAIEALKKQGLQIEHHIYDTKNNKSNIYQISKDESFKASDVVIGPFFFDKTLSLANTFPDKTFVTPIFSKKQSTDHHVNIIKSAVDENQKINHLAKYLISNYNKQKVIIIPDENKINKAKAIKLGNLLKKDSIVSLQYIYVSHNKKDETKIYMDKEELEKSVPEKKSVWVILISDQTVINSDVVNTYGVSALHNDVQLFTLKTFEDFGYLDFNHLASLNWSFPATQFDTFDSAENNKFKNDFTSRNHSFPSKYAYKGYDLTYDILVRVAKDSDSINTGLEAGVSKRIAHNYNYKKTSYGDYINTGMMLVSFTKDMNFELQGNKQKVIVKDEKVKK